MPVCLLEVFTVAFSLKACPSNPQLNQKISLSSTHAISLTRMINYSTQSNLVDDTSQCCSVFQLN